MQVSWLLENDTFGEACVTQLAEEIDRQGMKATYAAKVPMRSEETYLDIFPPGECVVFYGSLGFAKQIREEASWIPGVFNNPANFMFTKYCWHFRHFLLAQEFTTLKWGNLLDNKEFLYEYFGASDAVFMRPNSGEKPFTGQLIYKEEFEKRLPQLGYEVIPDDLEVIISPPRNIEVEWRFVVVDRKVITGSRYSPMWLRLDKDEDHTASIFAQHVVDGVRWTPDRVWCLDICRTNAGNYYIVEINSFSCSGLYACNPKPIVTEVSRIALEEWKKNQNVS